MLKETILKRFNELEREKDEICVGSGINSVRWQKWATNVLNLLQGIFTEKSDHYQNFKKIYSDFNYFTSKVNEAWGIFLAAKADYEGGYLFKLESSLSGEIFGDFVTLAKHSLREGNKDVAAVLTCAALGGCPEEVWHTAWTGCWR